MVVLSSVQALALKSPSQRVMVAGASGRLGRLVVRELLIAPNSTVQVCAAVRDVEKAKKVLLPFLDTCQRDRLDIVQVKLNNLEDLKAVTANVDRCVWCATGFTDQSSALSKITGLLRLKFRPRSALDIKGMELLGSLFKEKEKSFNDGPHVVLCSSAGVTRPSWSDEKKEKFAGAADIPIVRLNPFNILDIKAKGEQILRDSGASYCIVRPTGLNDKHPNGRPILSQGDLAVGRINRFDVAQLLVSILQEPAAVGKTIEAVSVAELPYPRSFGAQLDSLRSDIDGPLDDVSLERTYALLQQLVPGEIMQPEKLAMGQSYEQLDKGELGRLGERGTEDVPIAPE